MKMSLIQLEGLQKALESVVCKDRMCCFEGELAS